MIVLLLSWILQFDHVWSHILVGKASISSSCYTHIFIFWYNIPSNPQVPIKGRSHDIRWNPHGFWGSTNPSTLISSAEKIPQVPNAKELNVTAFQLPKTPEPPALNWRLTRVWCWDNWDPLSFCCLEKLLQHKTVFVTYVNLI